MEGIGCRFRDLRGIVRALLVLSIIALFTGPSSPLVAQATGTVQGTVTEATDGSGLRGVIVSVEGTGISTVTDRNGAYTLNRVPVGAQVILVRWLGYRPQRVPVSVTADATTTADVAMEAQPVTLAEVVVEGVTRAPERVVEAPAAVAVVSPQAQRDLSVTGQAPKAVEALPGADVVQSGVNDFNVNARGFNSTLNRRVLVLQDGRDLALAFLGSQEWSALSIPLEDLGRLEMVRGPGSALYGANAFSGVLNITTPTAREVAGTKLTVAGGELSTFKADLRHAGVAADGRFGYRFNGGYYRSDSWSRSRTNIGDLATEYSGLADTVITPSPGFELVPLAGQTKEGAPLPFGPATGDPDPLQSFFGSARFDYYADDGSVFTIDGGAAQSENEVFVTGIGRVQVQKALRPWARAAWAAERFNVMAWWSGRNTIDPQKSLASGLDLLETSHLVHGEAQFNFPFAEERGRVVIGASARAYLVDTELTLMAAANDDRSDGYYSGYAQIEFEVSPQVKLLGAARVDESDLFEPQFSPKGALVITPTPDHSIRFTVNRAFQTPNYSEFFLNVPAGAPADFSLLEAGLRASPLGPVLAGVPDGQLFDNSAAVAVWAQGNAALNVEHVTSLEAGYKGQLGRRVFVTVDGYWSRLTDFVTDLLPGINPAFGAWTAPAAVPEAFRPALEQAVRDQLLAAGQTVAALGLTRRNGTTAIVVSYGNAGKVDEYGVELGTGIWATDELLLEGNYTFFEFDVKSQALGDQLLPNTPQHRANLSVAYQGRQGFDFRVVAHLVDSYQWAAGVFGGPIPDRQFVDVSAGYQINPYLRIHAIATNVFDQERYQIYGGSVIGRRFLGGLTATY